MTTQTLPHSVKGVSTDSVYAWKMAHVYVAPRHNMSLRFRPMISPHPAYGLNETAICSVHSYHTMPPYDDCHCGFNAWQQAKVALEYFDSLERADSSCCQRYRLSRSLQCPALLRVRLSGDIIEGTLSAAEVNKWGYRASRQLITDVFFGAGCYQAGCDAKAVGLSVTRHAYKLPRTPGVMFRPVRPACTKHNIRVILQPKELMSSNDVGIHPTYPSE